MMGLPSSDFLHTLADAADKETMSRFRTELDTQSKPKEGYTFDPVTEADREAERVMRDLISAKYPEHSILGEEYGASGSGSIQWVLDPIDGTRPYLLGLPVWGTLIGVKSEGRATLGMMSQPVTRERFWADDTGSWIQSDGSKKPLRTSVKTELSQAILHTNSPENPRRHLDLPFDALTAAVKMTRYGGECYAFAMVAAGRIDLAIEFNLEPYDIVPLIPIIEKAGGVVTTLSGEQAENGGRILASANRTLHDLTLKLLRK